MTAGFSQVMINFIKAMVPNKDFEIIHYGHEQTDIAIKNILDDHITVVTNDDFQQAGYFDYDRTKEFHKRDDNGEIYNKFYSNASHQLRKNVSHGDFILSFGCGHEPMMRDLKDVPAPFVEPTIGYLYPYAPYRIYSSYNLMSLIYGIESGSSAAYKETQLFYDKVRDWDITFVDNRQNKLYNWGDIVNQFQSINKVSNQYSKFGEYHLQPRWKDSVIPHIIDIDDFDYRENSEKEDYYLFIGRVIYGKGIEMAIKVSQEMGKKLIVLGQGDLRKELGYNIPEHVQYFGRSVGLKERCHFMSKAKLVFVPSLYCEPFGLVVPESNISGTPVLTTDWGAFPETVLNGVNGYRCRSFNEFCMAADNIDNIKSADCYKYASQYRPEVLEPKFSYYFQEVKDYISHRNSDTEHTNWRHSKNFWYRNQNKENPNWLNNNMINPPTINK